MEPKSVVNRIQFSLADRKIRGQVDRVEAWLRLHESELDRAAPVAFFNASTRINHLSLNGAFSLLAAWAIRSSGNPVRYLVCEHGLQQCVLGTVVARPDQPPPCEVCVRYSDGLFPAEFSTALTLDRDRAQAAERDLMEAGMAELAGWSFGGLQLGVLCLPALRWALRRHTLTDDAATRRLFRQYLASAHSLATRLEEIFKQERPRALVLFNGIMYPEAVARAVAERQGIPTMTHEVGLTPHSTFFSHQDATFRQVAPYALAAEQEAELDQYLAARRTGQFSMAGIQFWPELLPLPERIAAELDSGRPLVTVFTNVVFDTSQAHANTLYLDMFDWLTDVARAVNSHPEILFVIRAHPDENRPGKASRETVADWFQSAGLDRAANAVIVGPDDHVNSYELIGRSKFVTVYSSSIGLEATIVGAPVLCAGRARYTQAETVTFPNSAEEYRQMLEEWLAADQISVPGHLAVNARAFLYFELKHASFDLSEFLSPYPVLAGMVAFTDFEPERLLASPELSMIRRGILEGAPFTIGELPEREAV